MKVSTRDFGPFTGELDISKAGFVAVWTFGHLLEAKPARARGFTCQSPGSKCPNVQMSTARGRPYESSGVDGGITPIGKPKREHRLAVNQGEALLLVLASGISCAGGGSHVEAHIARCFDPKEIARIRSEWLDGNGPV